jgi:hypothetical protein
MQRRRITTSGAALCVVLAIIVISKPAAPRVSAQGNGSFSFALIGDMPYGPEGDLKYPNTIADINADRKLAFVVHDGDIKNGSSLCSDAMYSERLDLFNSFLQPVVYVPGDNEWTDCHRANNGAYDPLERLALLRSLFFPNQQSLGQRTMPLKRQSTDPAYAAYPENVLWMMKGVVFAGLHVVGSNNNLGRTPAADAEYVARNAATLDWLRRTFAVAKLTRARAVMLVIQANLGFELAASQRTGFNDFLAVLEAETLAYGRPVVLVHGDSHYFRIDKPMLGTISRRRIESFTRVETFGENDNHWLHVTVAPENPHVFVFDQRLVTANLVQH